MNVYWRYKVRSRVTSTETNSGVAPCWSLHRRHHHMAGFIFCYFSFTFVQWQEVAADGLYIHSLIVLIYKEICYLSSSVESVQEPWLWCWLLVCRTVKTRFIMKQNKDNFMCFNVFNAPEPPGGTRGGVWCDAAVLRLKPLKKIKKHLDQSEQSDLDSV